MNFYKSISISIFLVYFLVLVGSVVRITGSGMGCPDWPQCFGKWVPPTNESELPVGYENEILKHRIKKNTKLSKLTRFFGIKLVDDTNKSNINQKIYFNTKKAWIEYLNRIVGVFVGFFVLLNVVFSLFKRHKNSVRLLSILALVATVFQGYVGSVVVSTNLLPGLITFHMLLAILILLLLIHSKHVSVFDFSFKLDRTSILILLGLAALIIQITFGTFVRERVDYLHNYEGISSGIIPLMGNSFVLHKYFSFFVLALVGINWYYLFTEKVISSFYSIAILSSLLLTFVGGVVMQWYDIPYLVQPTHLFLAILLVGMFYKSLLYYNSKSLEKVG